MNSVSALVISHDAVWQQVGNQSISKVELFPKNLNLSVMARLKLLARLDTGDSKSLQQGNIRFFYGKTQRFPALARVVSFPLMGNSFDHVLVSFVV